MKEYEWFRKIDETNRQTAGVTCYCCCGMLQC